jgi:hypothetical protein
LGLKENWPPRTLSSEEGDREIERGAVIDGKGAA